MSDPSSIFFETTGFLDDLSTVTSRNGYVSRLLYTSIIRIFVHSGEREILPNTRGLLSRLKEESLQGYV